MQTKKISLTDIKGKLSRAEMKNIMAGQDDNTCLDQYSYDCSSTQKCCSGLKCETNGTGTGTICM